MSELKVTDLMTPTPMSVRPTARLEEVIELTQTKNLRHVPVVDESGHLLGLISHRDILRAQEGEFSGAPESEQQEMNQWIEARWIMTREVLTVNPSTPVLEAAHLLREHQYGCLPVIDKGNLVGILTESDFVRFAIRSLGDPAT